jgi:phenylpyruvate tautomerase PptA (4-oxalocrotonate tautomerase family)
MVLQAAARKGGLIMPLISIVTSARLPEQRRAPLLTELSRFVADQLGKPESYVMTSLVTEATMTFGGTPEPACFVELKNIGTFSRDQTAALSAALCRRLESALSVPPARIYIEFTNAQGHLWGHDGETFG